MVVRDTTSVTAVFRKLEKKRHWDNPTWLESREVQADAMKCLKTSQNKLSVYVLDRPDEQVERVVAALAASRKYLVCMDIAILPKDMLEKCDLQLETFQGDTPDSRVNEWHQHLTKLTLEKITRLATEIKCSGELKRFQITQVGGAIKHALDANYIDRGFVERNQELAKSLKKRGFM